MSTITLATDGSNWVTYQSQLIWAFNLRGWSDHLTTSTVPAAYITAGNINGQSPDQRWATEEAITKHTIAASLPDRIFNQVKSKSTTKEVWAAVKAIHQTQSTMIAVDLYKKLQNTKLEEAGDARAHFKGLLEIREQLASTGKLGRNWDDDEFVSVLLNSLPPSYRIVISAIKAATDTTGVSATPNQVIRIVTDEYDRRVSKPGKNGSDEVFATKSQRRRERRRRNAKCYKCHEKGHFQVNCQAMRSRRTERTDKKKPCLANQDCNSTNSQNSNARGQSNEKKTRHARGHNDNHHDNRNDKSNVASTLDIDAGAATKAIEDDEPDPQVVHITAPSIHQPEVQNELHNSGASRHTLPLFLWSIPSRAITVIKDTFHYLIGTKFHALTDRNERHDSFGFAAADSASQEHSCANPGFTFPIDNADNCWASRDHETLTLSTASAEYLNAMQAEKHRTQFYKSTSTFVNLTFGPTTSHHDESAPHSSPNSNGNHHTQNAIDIRFHYDHPPPRRATNSGDNCHTLGHAHNMVDIRFHPARWAVTNANDSHHMDDNPCNKFHTAHTPNNIRFRSKVPTRQNEYSDTNRHIDIIHSSPTKTLPTYKVASYSLDLKICHA